MHCGFRQPHLVRPPSVVVGHLRRRPTKDRHELLRRRAVIGRDGRTGFPQVVGGAIPEASLIAPLPKLVSESRIGERPLKVVHKESQIAAG